VRAFIEVGPKGVLTGLVRSILQGRPHAALAVDSSGGQRSGLLDLARALAQTAALGHAVDLMQWEMAPEARRKPRRVVPLTGANYRHPRETGTETKKQSTMKAGAVSPSDGKRSDVQKSQTVQGRGPNAPTLTETSHVNDQPSPQFNTGSAADSTRGNGRAAPVT